MNFARQRSLNAISTALIIALTVCLAHGGWTPQTINVRDHGAVGDGKANETEAFLAAFKVCESMNAAIVFVPFGTYLVWPIELPKCWNSIFLVHGTIVAGAPPGEWHSEAFINIRGAYNFTLQGDNKGIIDGRGHVFWSTKTQLGASPSPQPTDPALLRFSRFEEDVSHKDYEPPRVFNILLTNAPGAHALVEATKVFSFLYIEGVVVESPPNVTSTAGFVAVNASLDVSQCDISTGGPNVLLFSPAGKSNRVYVGVSNSALGYGKGVTVVMRDGLAGNLSFTNNIFRETSYGFRILTPQGGTGTISGFFADNNNLTYVGIPIEIDMFYCPEGNCKNQTAGE